MQEKFDRFSIRIIEHTFPITLNPIGIKYFNVVLGMDWLYSNRVEILYFEKCAHVKLAEGRGIMCNDPKIKG